MNNPIPTRTRISWLAALLLMVMIGVFTSGCSGAEEPKVYKVGVLSGASDFLPIADGFKAGMEEIGYKEGENIVYDVQSADADQAALDRIAKQFVEDDVDMIFTIATEASLAAKAATEGAGIPVLFVFAATEETNLVDSVRQPGGNITGVRYPGTAQMAKRLELIHEIAPQAERVWVGYDTHHPNSEITLPVLRPVAESLGLTLVEVPAATIGDVEADLAARAESDDLGIDAMLLMPDGINHSPDGWGVISKFAAEQNVPIAGSFLYTVQSGAVIGNANDFVEMGKLAAPLAKKIFDGTQAGTIPLITPVDDIYINYSVAQDLGLTVDEGLLSQATEIIR